MPRGDALDGNAGRRDRTQSGVRSDDAARQELHAPSGTGGSSSGRGGGAGTAPEDPTKTTVVASPDARNDRAQRDGTYLEGPRHPFAIPLDGVQEEHSREW